MKNLNRGGRWHSRVSARAIRSKGVVLLALVVALLIALPSTAMGATAIMVGGLGQSTLDDTTMYFALGGKYSGSEWRRVNVQWPADAAPLWGGVNLADSVGKGAASLVVAIKNADGSLTDSGPITVLGTSAGSLVVDEAMRLLVNDPNWTPKHIINYVVLADSTQKLAGTAAPVWNPFDTLSGYTYKAPPITPYDLTVVAYEYDGFADFPDRWWNQYAVYNAVAGGILLHLQTWLAGPDLDKLDADKTVTLNARNGLTTTYLIHPPTLPLVQLYPWLAPMQDWLKEQIDAGYSRNDQTAASNSFALREAASLATDPEEIAPETEGVASTIDPSAGEDANLAEEQDQSQEPVVDETAASVDETAASVDETAASVDETAASEDETAAPVDGTPAPIKPTVGVAEATTHPSDLQLAKADADGTTLGKGPTLGGQSSPGVTGVDGRDDTAGKEAKGAADGATAGGGSTPGGTEGPDAK